MLIEIGCTFLAVYACGSVAVLGNRFGWWSNIVACVVGAVAMTGLCSLPTSLPDVAKLVVLIGFTALLRWLSSERRAFVATATPATLASEQPVIDDLFEFVEVPQ